ncbi:MAG: hypothetical protein LAT67_15690 [Balneolales bacterium]|nr:hypothetical protein [Balneolales bacterium]
MFRTLPSADFLSSKTVEYDVSGVTEAAANPDFNDFYGLIDLSADMDEKEMVQSIKESEHR